MISFWLAAALALPVMTGAALAQGSSPTRPSSITASRGPGLVTGTAGSPESVVMPGSPVNGTLMNNGNGTSTMMVPGQTSGVVPTPR
jgi:hypothetical protein